MHLFIVPLYFFHLLSRRSNNQFIKSDLWSPETKLWEQIRSQVHVPPLPPPQTAVSVSVWTPVRAGYLTGVPPGCWWQPGPATGLTWPWSGLQRGPAGAEAPGCCRWRSADVHWACCPLGAGEAAGWTAAPAEATHPTCSISVLVRWHLWEATRSHQPVALA